MLQIYFHVPDETRKVVRRYGESACFLLSVTFRHGHIAHKNSFNIDAVKIKYQSLFCHIVRRDIIKKYI